MALPRALALELVLVSVPELETELEKELVPVLGTVSVQALVHE